MLENMILYNFLVEIFNYFYWKHFVFQILVSNQNKYYLKKVEYYLKYYN